MNTCKHCGCDLDAAPARKKRSIPQHRRFFALVKAAFEHWPDRHRFKPMTVDHMRKWLTAKSGYVNVRTVDTTGMDVESAITAIAAELASAHPMHFTSKVGAKFHIIESKSIDFDTLPHLAACALFDAVADTIRAETGLDPDRIMPPIRKPTTAKRELMAEVPI